MDPGEGEATLGQALHDRSLRFFEHTVPPWELSPPCGAGWASTSLHQIFLASCTCDLFQQAVAAIKVFLRTLWDFPGQVGNHVIFPPSRSSNQVFFLALRELLGFSSRQVASVWDLLKAAAPIQAFSVNS